MEPNNITPNQPPVEPSGPPLYTPPPKQGLSRKAKGIIAGAIVLAGVAVLLVALFIGSQKKPQQQTAGPDSSLYYDRPGYIREGEGIGDPAALTSETTSKVVQYGGQNMLQPCTLITIKDLQDFGLQLLQNQLASPIEVSSFDGQSNVPSPSANEDFLPSSPDGNYCQYFLKDLERVTITAYQTPYASAAALDKAIARYQPVADTEGLKTYLRTQSENPKLGQYLIRDGNTALELYLETANTEVKDKILKLAAKRFINAKANPTPMQKFAFNSPVFPMASVSTCDIIDPASFRTTLGTEPSPTLTEMYGSAVGVIRLGDKDFNYVSYQCKRRSVERFSLDASSISISITTYETAEAAEMALKFDRTAEGSTQNLQEITPAIGDESFYADLAAMNNAIAFRKGRVVVHANVYGGKNDASLTPEKRIQMLTPLLKNAITGALKEY